MFKFAALASSCIIGRSFAGSCSQEDIHSVDDLGLSPYYILTHCSYYPNDPACADTGSYLQLISEAVSSSDCSQCYADYEDRVKTWKRRPDLCMGAEDVWASGCYSAYGNGPYLDMFYVCSGFHMSTVPPPVPEPVTGACTPSDVIAAQYLIPAPYYTLTHCGYYPNDEICVVDRYLAEISAVVSSPACSQCYADYEYHVKTWKRRPDLCMGSEDVWASDCFGPYANGPYLDTFATCSGYRMDTYQPMSVSTTTKGASVAYAGVGLLVVVALII